MIPPDEPAPSTEAERLLDAYVETILAGAHLPRAASDDLAEELFGHLTEHIRAHEAGGLSEAAAARRAIEEFGAAEDLAGDFSRTFHSRVWASTIGVLLAGAASSGPRPGVVPWLRLMVAVAALFMAGGLIVLGLTGTPLVAVSSVLAYGDALAVCILAYRALRTGRRWSLWYAIALALDFIVSGIWMALNPATPGTITIPIGALVAGGILIAVTGQWERLREYTAGSPRIGAGVTAALIASLIVPLLVGPVLAAVGDPTQVGPADVAVHWAMTCDRGDVPIGTSLARDVQRIDLAVEITWRRGDLLPQGLLAGLENQIQGGDSAGYGTAPDVTSPVEAWTIASTEDPVDVQSGQTAGWFGADSPSVGLLPADIQGGFTTAIDQSAIRAGHTIRASWQLTPSDPYKVAWPRIRGAYAHLDRFLLLATVGCGESVRAVEAPIGVP